MIEAVAIQMIVDGLDMRLFPMLFAGIGLLVLDVGADFLGFPG